MEYMILNHPEVDIAPIDCSSACTQK